MVVGPPLPTAYVVGSEVARATRSPVGVVRGEDAVPPPTTVHLPEARATPRLLRGATLLLAGGEGVEGDAAGADIPPLLPTLTAAETDAVGQPPLRAVPGSRLSARGVEAVREAAGGRGDVRPAAIALAVHSRDKYFFLAGATSTSSSPCETQIQSSSESTQPTHYLSSPR